MTSLPSRLIIAAVALTAIGTTGLSEFDFPRRCDDKNVEMNPMPNFKFVLHERVPDGTGTRVAFEKLVRWYCNRSNYPKDELADHYDFVFKTSFRRAAEQRTFKYLFLLTKHGADALSKSPVHGFHILEMLKSAFAAIKIGLINRSIEVDAVNRLHDVALATSPDQMSPFLATLDDVNISSYLWLIQNSTSVVNNNATSSSSASAAATVDPAGTSSETAINSLNAQEVLDSLESITGDITSTASDSKQHSTHKFLQKIVKRVVDEYL